MPSTDHPFFDFRNAVEQIATPEVERKPLLPIFEAIHNSIQSIQEANRDHGNITIDIVRNQNDLDPKAITTISISDNGLGFTTQNKNSFGRLFTTHKKNNFNCKGIGRLSFFLHSMKSTSTVSSKKMILFLNSKQH
ncbi:ATP-binding protein [Desulfovibrio mangrovi]|uniref:ATP-binding protein n=1 Tax=Desulfovibrio mangrovi TaxID=2976983 RepID=UPI002245C744|nr:ATP-binding protein [Desulfovibrio mangrovi]UZP66034.1 ATP-binding protein [Desulfovibrio mangrovi]